MATKALPCPTVLRQLLRYEPETGALFWRRCSPALFAGSKHHSAERVCEMWNAKYAGREAFTASDGRYKIGKIRGKMLKAHRVAWAVSEGRWPVRVIDHINRDGLDNRRQNLRDVSYSENNRNQRPRRRKQG